MLKDTYRHKGMRRKLVDALKAKNIKDEEVLKAIDTIPRHFFLDNAFTQIAYEDRAFPIGEDQTISQPFTVAYQTQLLEVKKNDKILEIGTGSGYQACVLAEMGARVFTIERLKKLHDRTRVFLPQIGYPNIKCFFDDGFRGLPSFAPFDKILVTAAAKEVPEELLNQLKPNGFFVIPTGNEKAQRMLRFVKMKDGDIEREEYDWFSFVPMLKGKNW